MRKGEEKIRWKINNIVNKFKECGQRQAIIKRLQLRQMKKVLVA